MAAKTIRRDRPVSRHTCSKGQGCAERRHPAWRRCRAGRRWGLSPLAGILLRAACAWSARSPRSCRGFRRRWTAGGSSPAGASRIRRGAFRFPRESHRDRWDARAPSGASQELPRQQQRPGGRRGGPLTERSQRKAFRNSRANFFPRRDSLPARPCCPRSERNLPSLPPVAR